VLAAASVLGVISAALGSSLEIVSGPNRKTRGNLFILACAESGTGKTETFQLAAQPLTELEDEAANAWNESHAPRIRANIAIVEGRIKRLTGRAAATSNADSMWQPAEELQQLEAELNNLRRQLAGRPCFRVGDVTKEKLAILMQGQAGESIASMSSDARGIVQILNGRYSPGGDVDFYCAAYSGDAITVDRVKSDDRIRLRAPCLSAIWMMQPDIVRAAFLDDAMTASGLLPRFITFDSLAEPKIRSRDTEAIAEEVQGRWKKLVSGLCLMRSSPLSALVQISARACDLLIGYENENIRRRQPQGDLADLAPFVARWSENAWRVALVLHASIHGENSANHELAPETADSAVRLMRWFTCAQLDLIAAVKRNRLRARIEALELVASRSSGGRVTLRLLAKNHGFTNQEVRSLVRSFPERLTLITVQPPEGGRPSMMVALTPNRQNPP
ncbi:MAG: DUF3987 domain-containing protein, partial [Verrucomicrobiaceae bacterium]